MATQRLELEVVIDETGAVTGIKKIESETKKSSDSTISSNEKQGASLGKLKGGWLAVVGAVVAVGTAIYAAIKVGERFADAAAQQTQALNKLEAIAKNTGASFSKLNQSANELSSDGLLTFQEASQALANLLATGLSLDKSIELLKIAKDNAITNRQAHLQLGEAVVIFTEGIRNQNSMLTDSVGITKNYNAILEEGAKSIGKKVSELTDLQKVQLVANGFIKEGAAFEGQAAKASDAYAAAKARANAAVKDLAIAIGGVLTPAMKFWQNTVASVTNSLRDLFGPKTQSEADKFQFKIKQNSEMIKVLEDSSEKIKNKWKEMVDKGLKEIPVQQFTKDINDNNEAINRLKIENEGYIKSLDDLVKKEEAAAAPARKKIKDQEDQAKAAQKRAEAEKELADTLKSIRDKDEDLEIAKLQRLLGMVKKGSKDEEDILHRIQNIKDKLREEDEKKEEEKYKKIAERVKRIYEVTKQWLDLGSAIAEAAFADEQARLDADYRSRLENLDQRNEFTEALEAMDAEDRARKEADLQAEIDAAKAAGDTTTANEKQRELDRMKLQDEAAERDKKIAADKAALEEQQKKDAYEITKKQFFVDKAFRIAQGLAQTASSVISALAAPPFPPLSIPQSIAAGVAGAIQVGIVAAQQPPPAPYAHGGTLGGISPSGDVTPFMGNRGETIINTAQGQNLFNALDRSGLLSPQAGSSVFNNSSTINNDHGRVLNFYGPVTLQTDKDFDSQVSRRFAAGGSFR